MFPLLNYYLFHLGIKPVFFSLFIFLKYLVYGFINNNPDIALKNEEELKEASFVLNRLSRMVFPFNQLYFKYLNNHLHDINFRVNASNILGTIQGVKTR